ncbi:MAG TPA: phosphoribosylamine--glycine ligase [Bryobacteraceae bacterium]|nr:phosphoribosylamine--glycine ligase [Bryobacteraceae bacterium]
MNLLVIGSGGREHAIAWRLSQSPLVKKLYAAPGNPGIARVAECRPASTVDDYLRLADELNIDLTVVGPEGPLVAGIVDRFRASGRAIFGPTAAAAQLEGSKSFSKDFMIRAGIPTARYTTVTNIDDARNAIAGFTFPVVLKADGLAAGKGVVIAQSNAEAEAALPALLGSRLVIEEFLEGEEVSFIVLSDGKNVLPLQPSQDHKAVRNNDEGPNTGGMGAYCDSRILTAEQTATIMSTVIEPTIRQMAAENNPFTGFLYAGLMMTADGPKVLEFNARLGDPETQALLHRMDSDFVPALHAAAKGDLSNIALDWKSHPSLCVVLAAHGYPGEVRTGDMIHGIDAAESAGAVVFQAGTKQTSQGLVTSGGRVLGVTASGPDLKAAMDRAYSAVGQVRFDGMHYRTDIGAKGLKRY